MNEKSPGILMELAKNGDDSAFSALYGLYFIPVFRYVYFRVGDKSEAEDLTQTVFLKVYASRAGFKDVGKTPLAYFFKVAGNAVIDYFRKKKPAYLEECGSGAEKIPDGTESPEKALDDKEIVGKIAKAIKLLTKDQQEIITLKFINELSNREISEISGKSEEAVRQIQCRAIKSLKNKLVGLKII